MRECFEIRDTDAGGRIGQLSVPRADITVETPALLPVINPNIDTISPRRLAEEFGAEILITNSYIIYGTDDVRERALEDGLHEMFEFPGAIVTDSGSFQLAEYGEIDVTTEEILEFQHAIGSDIGTPVDIPTPPDVSRERAEDELETTQERLELAETVETGEMLVNAPVQGSTYPDLREAAGRHADATALDVFPVGAVVPLMNEYRYDDVVDVVAGAKRGLGADAPVHLFGAGHPMMFALGVAMGCDLFDSAAYALYARDDRYLTVRGTRHLEDLDYLPCSCPICTDFSPDELRMLEDDRREEELAAHNLHVTFAEIRRIKQAIRAGNLLELVEGRARSHPTMLDGYRALLDHAGQLERTDPVSKGTFFYTSHESARRPEVIRHHRRLERLSVPDSLFLTEGEPASRETFDESWRVEPPFGPFPRALSRSYPLTAEVPGRTDRSALRAAADGVRRLVETNPETAVTLGHRGWPESVLDRVPDRVALVDLTDE
ncbi:tRNA guanosine(15) transglycosylase TgtA [Natrarchaeobius halalkaliphilus]|uniref:tRNA-guanine(15) transglycosylase n=1 Tax=Natrarchaeobius halalkaliphilus TaxID=1679091 RepID=A0A3N6M172_9EURY|nr:tRNA guanosine(15) transglycosylase TgtA [Natrarchaeobius halalkaliphilus]RQG88821.1 tRNA guanosine(15) transglycosylase TgtA [Natrarchaeobius halalkaliphilus]